MSDTWSDIQAQKSRQMSMREKLQRRKREREGLVAGIAASVSPVASAHQSSSSSTTPTRPDPASSLPGIAAAKPAPIASTAAQLSPPRSPAPTFDPELVNAVESRLQISLVDVALEVPISATLLASEAAKQLNCDVPLDIVKNLLEKFAAQQLVSVTTKADEKTGSPMLYVTSTDHAKLSAFAELYQDSAPSKRRKLVDGADSVKSSKQLKQSKQAENGKEGVSIESLLSMQSAKERESKKMMEEIQELLSKPSAKEQSIVEKFKSQGGAQVQEFCQFGTREECTNGRNDPEPCRKLHFKKIIHKHTDENLGDCSFLNTCFHMDVCKYVHYEIDYPEHIQSPAPPKTDLAKKSNSKEGETRLFPPQWIHCDLRQLDMSILGKFAVVMADPPWDIHMELPYGTMGDEEMRNLSVPVLSDDGYIFLWVTGRAMELGRECLQIWGYERVDELIWVKTNQLQRIIRTGRTGHWMNHGKEHCLVGVKGNPKNMNRGLDCDILVAEVRATSHKPDEIYGIIERLSPGTRKIELFGRPHNVQPNWITLGNQLDGIRLLEPEVVRAFKKRYPDCNPA